MIDVGELIRDCHNPRCKGQVIDALAIGPSSNKEVLLDPVQVSWANNGRYRVRQHQPAPTGTTVRVHVDELRAAGQGFGSALLYQKHAWVCGGGVGTKSRSREADG